jgi:hypothetical protein
MLREYFTRSRSLLARSTSLPMENNEVTLDPEIKDAWGLPAVRTTFHNHPDVIATMKWLLERELEIFDPRGAMKVWAQPQGIVLDVPAPDGHLPHGAGSGKFSGRSIRPDS